MVPGSQRLVRRARTASVVVALITALATVAGASAADLGGLRGASFKAMQFATTNPAPTVLRCDDFTRAASTGRNLDGRPVQLPARCGTALWKVDAGNWRINGGRLDPGGGFALASMPVGTTNMSVQSNLINANGGSRIGGVTASVSANGRTYLVATISAANQVQLRYVVNGASTTLTTVSTPIAADVVIRLTRSGTSVTVTVGATIVATYTLSSTQSATLDAGTRAGLFWDAGSPVRFSNFLVTTPSP